MKQQGIVLLAAGLILVVVLILTGYVEKAENMQSMQEILSQEEPLTEEIGRASCRERVCAYV